MTLLSRGATFLTASLADAGGVTVSYTDGTTTASLIAVPSNTTYALTDSDGGQTLWTSRDYLVSIATLVAAGWSEPARGHKITETINGVAEQFEVLPPPGGQVFAREAGDTRFRIHTKRVDV